MEKVWKSKAFFISGFFLLTVILTGGCSTKAITADYKQIVIATGSPYELGLVDELTRKILALPRLKP